MYVQTTIHAFGLKVRSWALCIKESHAILCILKKVDAGYMGLAQLLSGQLKCHHMT